MNYDIFIEGFIGQSDYFEQGVDLKTIRDAVNSRPEGTTEITVIINSGGGSVREGLAIYDYLTTEIPITVNTHNAGTAGSMASILLQATANGGKRTSAPNAEVQVHNPYWTPEGPIPMNASDLISLGEDLQRNEDKLAAIYIATTGQDDATVRKIMNEDKPMSAEDAKKLNFIDEVKGANVTAKIYRIQRSGTEYRFAAFIDPKKESNMDLKLEFEKFTAKIEALVKGKGFKGETTKTSEGVTIYYSGALEVGTKCYTDEAMTTPCPDGVHTVGEQVYTIANGEVTEIKPKEAAAPEDKSAELTAEVETLRQQLAQKESELTAAKTDAENFKAKNEEITTEVEKINTEFQAFKGNFFTGDGQLKPEFQGFKPDPAGKEKSEKDAKLQRMAQKLADALPEDKKKKN